MKEFVFLTQADVKAWADSLFGKGQYQATIPKWGKELVIRHDLNINGLEILVYTTVVPEADRSRAKGEDAIRFVLYDRFAGKPAGSEKKVLRVDGESTVFERCTERVKELQELANIFKANDWFCKKCKTERAHTVERTNRQNGEKFRGCALFPKCGPDKLAVLQEAYPLKFNPWGVKPIVEVPVTPPVQVIKPCPLTRSLYAEMSKDGDLVPTQQFPELGYSFPFFNKVQSGVIASGVLFADANMVLGTATSSGKTIAAELAIAAILNLIQENPTNGKKAISEESR